MRINSGFDSGNIEIIDASEPSAIRLSIRPDAGGEHLQWFHFQVAGAAGTTCRFHIENASRCSYPDGWTNYRAVMSVNRRDWVRVPTIYEDGVLIICDTPSHDIVYYAYFAPYSQQRHLDVLAELNDIDGVQIDPLGTTPDGLPLDRIVVHPTVEAGKVRQIWIIARQHPGETMAQWWMEGFISRLLDDSDPIARQLREKAVFHLVPNMNPDGSQRGHLRCNALGANLNREWHTPTMDRSPEVKLVRDEMDETGVDLCLDIHGDESLPYNFVAAAEGIPSWTDRLATLTEGFKSAYEKANPDFQTEQGYELDAPGNANMSMCTNQVSERFDCLALTLEQPFKDNANAPDELVGWSPQRCDRLGASALDAIWAVIAELR